MAIVLSIISLFLCIVTLAFTFLLLVRVADLADKVEGKKEE